jgi:hypothetical protein
VCDRNGKCLRREEISDNHRHDSALNASQHHRQGS